MNNRIKNIFKIVAIIIVIIAASAIVALILQIAMFIVPRLIIVNAYPEDYETIDQVMPNNELFGNSSMNLVSSGIGRVCQWEDKILIATNSGVIAVSSDLKEYTKILDKKADFLNVIDDIIYYQEDDTIYKFNFETQENSEIFNPIYSISSMHVVGDKIFYFRWEDISFIGCIDLQTNKNSKLNCLSEISRIAGYREGVFYYTDSYNLYGYNVLENIDEEMPIEIEDYIYDIFLQEDNLFILYELDNERRVNVYNLESASQKDILLTAKKATAINSIITLNDKLIYEDYRSLYIYNIENHDLIEVESEGKCVEVYGTEQYIVARFKGDDISWYSIYDDMGNEVGERIYD